MIHTIETLKELHEQRFVSVDKALFLAAEEMARRLDVLNHFHELAREKERDFIGREAFETLTQRIVDDFASLRRELQTASTTAFGERESMARSISERSLAQSTANENRFGKIEGLQAKLVGGLVLGTFILPLITGMVIYILTKS